ncbi:hypothetical protein GGX14DRAFT_550973 [Mycena pura]|uniref:Uncharacterized protein n=1 Tax=Mycena pura TaxID=153505 RepID=A0AAD6VEB6_9AGAR|nr:hypothetical protein GGX14DRAFT_550973 [Mycena pura]
MPGDPVHVLLLPLPSWGHVRPLCVLAGHLVAEGNSTITLLMAPNLLEKARAEVVRQFPEGHPALQKMRIVSMFNSTETNIFKLIKPFTETYPTLYKRLHQGETIECATTGTTFDAVVAPSVAILDFFCLPQLQATRAISGTSTQIIAQWVTGGAFTIIRLFGPESLGGLGNFGERIDAEAERTGKDPVEIGDAIFRHTDGSVINIPGLPPMHDYEFFPQKLPFNAPVAPILRGGYAFLMECDGVIISTAEAYEKTSLDALKSWLTGLSKPLYALGPLVPRTLRSEATTSETDRFKTFLDEMQAQHGKHCVIYISFGTVFWPTVNDYVEELVEALLEMKAPFILCHASPFAKISDELRSKVVNSGIALLTIWCPQQLILSHSVSLSVPLQSCSLDDRSQATGWFLTHGAQWFDVHFVCGADSRSQGGHGGLMESLSSGVPLICWPFDADQPAAAKHLTHNLNVAFELVEVRTGLGMKPSYGSDKVPEGTREAVGREIRAVVADCRGETGKEKRKNAERLRAELLEAWSVGGPAKCAIGDFLGSLHH